MGMCKEQHAWYFPVSVVFITCEIHISTVPVVVFTSIPFQPQNLSSSLLLSHNNHFMPRSNATSRGPTTILHGLRKRNSPLFKTSW